ncbi:hypothetical protein QQP08_001572 [Theobroma cacao]|nr:hypothetical protein QQP08_001572 [Theobroma cacao]
MSVYDAAFVNTELSKPTSIFGLRLWVVIGILLGSLIVLTLFLLSLCLTARRKSRRHQHVDPTPPISKEIQEIVHHPPAPDHHHVAPPVPEIQVDLGKVEHRVVLAYLHEGLEPKVVHRDERRVAREASNSHSDDQQTNRNATKLGDRRFDGASASDTSEGDTGRNHHQPTSSRNHYGNELKNEVEIKNASCDLESSFV